VKVDANSKATATQNGFGGGPPGRTAPSGSVSG
jgi:hypothetical protein